MKNRKIISTVLAVAMAFSTVCAMSTSASAEWVKSSSGYSYKSDKTGDKLTGWQTIGGNKYCFDKNGIAYTGWKTIGGNKYYFNAAAKGKMLTGLVKVGSDHYYFGNDGVVRTGLVKISGKTYYFDKEGAMKKNATMRINGKTYKFGADGALVSGDEQSSSYSLSAPMKGLKWGMTADEIVKKKGLKLYIYLDPMLINFDGHSGEEFDYYLISEDGLCAYGTTLEYSAKNVNKLNAAAKAAGFKYIMANEESGYKQYAYMKGDQLAFVQYNSEAAMTLVFDPDISLDTFDDISGSIDLTTAAIGSR